MHCNLVAGPAHDTPVADIYSDLIVQSPSYSEEDGTTTLIIKRSIDTGDNEDVVIRVSWSQNHNFGWR